MEFLILALPIILLLVLSRRGSKQRKDMISMQQGLEPGQEVMMGSGQFGRVLQVVDDRVELEVADGVSTWWLKQAIARRVEPLPEDEDVAVEDSLGDVSARDRAVLDGTLDDRPLDDRPLDDRPLDDRPVGGRPGTDALLDDTSARRDDDVSARPATDPLDRPSDGSHRAS